MSRGSDVDYRGTIDDPRVDEVRILRPQEIPRYVAEGRFDLGITGRDWIEERNADVVTLTELHYSKATARPIRMVLAVGGRLDRRSRSQDLPAGLVVHTEYPELTRRYFEQHGIDADVQLSYGATEAKVPDIADAVVEITETGRALRAAGLRIIDTILVSYTELIANPAAYADPDEAQGDGAAADPAHRRARSAGRVLLKLNVDAADLDGVIALLPALKSPTVSKLFGEDGFAVETVVAKSEINTLIPALNDLRRATGSSSCRSPRSSREGRCTRVAVVEFDDHAGRGEVEAGGGLRFPFHCTAIADGTRTIGPTHRCGSASCSVRSARYEATAIAPSD